MEKEAKKLVVYYSLEGNTKRMAETIADTIKADILPLMPKEEVKANSFTKYVWGSFQVLMNQEPSLEKMIRSTEAYDLVFIGTPVWDWTYAPPLNTFFSQVSLDNKKVALFCCHAGQKGKVFEKMKSRLLQSQVVGTIDFHEPKRFRQKECETRAQAWATEMVAASQ